MENLTTLRTKRLKNFMLDVLNDQSCPGVEWVDKSEGEFKIAWYDIKKVEPAEIPQKFKLFVLWAEHTGKYKEGDKLEYPKFKTRLRTALTKLGDFIETTKEEHKKNFRSYKFMNWKWENSDTNSPDSTVPFDYEGIHHDYLNHTQVQTNQSQTQTTDAEISQLPSFLQEHCQDSDNSQNVGNANRNQIKTPVATPFTGQNLAFCFTNPGESTANFSAVPLLPLVNSQHSRPEDQQTQPQNIQPTHTPSHDILHQAMNMSNIMETSTNFDSASRSFLINQDYTAMGSPNLIVGGAHTNQHDETEEFKDLLQYCDGDHISSTSFSELSQSSLSLPSELEDIPLDSLLQLPSPAPQGRQGMDHSSVGDNKKPVVITKEDEFKSCLEEEEFVACSAKPEEKHAAVSKHLSAGLPEKELQDLPKKEECAGLSGVTYGMIVSLYYGRPKTKVKEWTVSEKGCRLFSQERVFDTAFIDYEKMYGPKSAEQLEMPPVEDLATHTDEIKNKISKVLDKMSLGLVLTFQDGDIYASRKSRCHIFATDLHSNSQRLERKTNNKVFDYKLFTESLEKGPRRKPFFILTIGRNVDLQSEDKDMLDSTLIYAYVYHKQAQQMANALRSDQEIICSLESLKLSDANSIDKLEQQFRTHSTKK